MNICGVNKVDEWNELPPIQTSVDSSQYVEVPCVTSLPREDQASLEFRLDKSDTAVDIGSMLMYTTLQVLKGDGSKLVDTDQVAAVNLMAYSMFESVEVFISDQRVNQASSKYPWMCYIRNILNETNEAKKTVLKAAGWEADEPNMFDRVGIDAAGISNKGWVERAAMVQYSNVAEYCSRVILDFLLPAQVLPVQTELALRFNRVLPTMCLIGKDGAYRIRINEAKLYVLKMSLTSQSLQRHTQILTDGGVKYPAVKYTTRTLSMMKGSQNLDWIPFTGAMPQKIFITQILQEAYNERFTRTPLTSKTLVLRKFK